MGLDSECDVFIDTQRPGNGHAGEAIAAIRRSLIAEHTGIDEEQVDMLAEHHGSYAAMIDHTTTKEGRNLTRYHPPDLTEAETQLAHSQLLDPENPDDMFEPFAKGGLFRDGSRLGRIRNRIRRKRGT